jgi:hypothetical protein
MACEFFRRLLFFGIVAGSAMLFGHAARAGEDIRDLLLKGKPVLDLRYRFEFVDQDNLSRDAKAHTLRTRAGFETGRFHGLGAGADFEWIEAVGSENFNSTVNGKTQFPVVVDPNDVALNQLYFLSEGTIPKTRLKVGRQRIIWDNARFIGNLGFRQNEQTFDALRVGTTFLPDTDIGYTYLEEAHRIFGRDSAVGRQKMNSHAVRVQYTGLDFVTVTPFALLLDYDQASQNSNSSATVGALLKGKYELSKPWTAHYMASAARQQDYGDNTVDFDLWYYAVEPGLSYDFVTANLGYEVLQGDGTQGFRTPLATGHKFNGLTDRFLTTPADGLEDLYLKVSLKVPGKGLLSGISVKGSYHEFWADEGDAHYGSEWDLGIFKKLKTSYGTFLLGVQYADYNADEFSTDISKLWLTLQFKMSPKPYQNLVAGLSDD